MEKVKFGLIGTGTWGNVHAETYSTYYRASLAAVCDLDDARARSAADRWGVRRVYTDYREMLRDPDIDAVAVATPDFAHREPIVAAARAGKHIIVEKPLATTCEDLDQIAEAVTKAGVKFMVDFHNRWAPPLVVARNDIEKGTIGEIVSAYLRLNNTLFVPLKMLSWSAKSSILWFLGSHTVDALRFLLRDEVARVYSVSRSGVLRGKGVDVPDLYQSILEFARGPVATIENHWIMPDTSPSYNDFKVSVVGSKGMFNMDLTHSQLIERYVEGRCATPTFWVPRSSVAVTWALSTRASAILWIASRTTSRWQPRLTTVYAFQNRGQRSRTLGGSCLRLLCRRPGMMSLGQIFVAVWIGAPNCRHCFILQIRPSLDRLLRFNFQELSLGACHHAPFFPAAPLSSSCGGIWVSKTSFSPPAVAAVHWESNSSRSGHLSAISQPFSHAANDLPRTITEVSPPDKQPKRRVREW